MRFLSLLAVLLFGFAAQSNACSVKEGYKIPTNFELVQQATVIVLARVNAVPTDAEAVMVGGGEWVTLEPIRFLKGKAPTEQLRLMGWRPPANWDGVSTSTTLAQSHFSAGLGACVRQFYASGEMVVAMFAPHPEAKQVTGLELTQLFEPFARIVETVDSPDDIWVRAIEKYVAIQSGSPENLNERIKVAATTLESAGTAETQAIAADLEYQLTRKDPTDVWTNFSTPMSTTSGVAGKSGIGLYCLAGTGPGILMEGMSPDKVEVAVGDAIFAAKRTSPTPIEKMIVSPPEGLSVGQNKSTSIYRVTDGRGLIAAMRSTNREVRIDVDGKNLVVGRPLDALIRWAGQCEKLQRLPAPTEEELRNPMQ